MCEQIVSNILFVEKAVDFLETLMHTIVFCDLQNAKDHPWQMHENKLSLKTMGLSG